MKMHDIDESLSPLAILPAAALAVGGMKALGFDNYDSLVAKLIKARKAGDMKKVRELEKRIKDL